MTSDIDRCAVLTIKGSEFLPSTTTTTNTANLFVLASAGSQVTGPYGGFFIAVDSHGSFTALFPVCGLSPGKVQLEIASEDSTTYLYANIIYTTSG